MRPIRAVLAVLLAVCLGPAAAGAQNQSQLNPEISFIADTRAKTADATEDDLELVFESLEIAAQGYLSPFVRADVFLGVHSSELHVEEAYATFMTLPAGLGLRTGVYRVDLGRFNQKHPHQLPFLDYPLFVTEYLGEEGYGDVGVNPSLLLDVGGVPVTVSAAVLRGELEEHAHAGEEDAHKVSRGVLGAAEEDSAEAAPPRELSDLAFNGRVSAFFTLGDATWLEVGGTAGTGMLDVAEDLRTVWFGGDFKLRWRPDRRRSLTVAGEVLAQRRDVSEHEDGTLDLEVPHDDTVTPVGFFAFADLQFRRKWNLGALVDYAQDPADPDLDRLGYGVFAGYSVFEESTVIRLLVRRDDLPGGGDPETGIQLQVLFGLGPHQAHRF